MKAVRLILIAGAAGTLLAYAPASVGGWIVLAVFLLILARWAAAGVRS